MPQWSEDGGSGDPDDVPRWLLTVMGGTLILGVALWLWLVKGGVLTLTTGPTLPGDTATAPSDRSVVRPFGAVRVSQRRRPARPPVRSGRRRPGARS